MRDGSTFTLAGTIWHREWTGDAYRWTSGNAAVGWRDIERVDTGFDDDGEVTTKGVRYYYFELDGVRSSVKYLTTKAAMIAAKQATSRAEING